MLSVSFNCFPWRPQRPNLRPVYPPVDPFGNTEYIPLPGPSSPHYALPIHNNENPHFSKTKHRFVRPIRQSKYPKNNFFKYDSSKAFYKNKKEVLRQIQFNNLPWNILHTNVLLLILIYVTSAILWPQDHETIFFLIASQTRTLLFSNSFII